MPESKNSNHRVTRLVEPLLNEPVERFILPNGLTVVIRPDHSADVASVQVWVKTGSIHEEPRLGSGVSHYLEHMLFKGTKKRAGREISRIIQEHGGHINAYTSYDRTVYYIDLPSEHTVVAMDVLADAVFNSTLPKGEVARERDVILREIDMGQDDPDQIVGQGLMETAFRQHPYRFPIIGYRDVFSRLDRAALVNYYESRYVPNNAVLVVAGAVDPDSLRGEIDRLFGGVPRSQAAPVLVPDEPGQLAGRTVHFQRDVQVFRAALGYQVPGLAHEDTPALDVLSLVLAHGDSSILWRALREKRRLVHHIDASNWNPGTKGLFYLSVVTDTDKGGRALAAVAEEIARATEKGFTERQLRQAVRQALVAEINVRRTVSGQAGRLGVAEVVVGDLGYPAVYLSRLARLTPGDLRRVAQTYLQPSSLTIATMEPGVSSRKTPISTVASKTGRDFEDHPLPNGARILTRENHRLPKIHMRILWQGGGAFEEAGTRGATAMLATLLTKDTKARSAAAVAHAIEQVGGSMSHFAGNNSFGLSVEVLPDDLDLALNVLEEAVLRPVFRPATVRLERDAQIAELAEDDDDIVTFGRRHLRRLLFGGHYLAIESGGTTADLEKMGAAELRKLHRKLVVSGNTVFAISGDFDSKVVLPRLKRLLNKIPKAVRPRADAVFPGSASPGEHKLPMKRQQVVVYQGYSMPGLLSDDFYVGEVADELFSGMSSNLFERVREEKGMAYFVRSSRVVGLDDGMFFFIAGTSPEQYREVVAEFELEIARVKRGAVSKSEIERCRTRLKASRRMSMQSNSACATHAALNALYGLPVNDWQNYDARIDAVSVADLKRFARTFMTTKSRVRLLAGAVEGA